jgi:hypothetical protein
MWQALKNILTFKWIARRNKKVKLQVGDLVEATTHINSSGGASYRRGTVGRIVAIPTNDPKNPRVLFDRAHKKCAVPADHLKKV